MDNLKGKTILIGKEPGRERLMIAVQGCANAVRVGQEGSVYGSVSRCIPEQGVAHASLAVDMSGNLILTNMKEKNVTFVNGAEIASKRVTPASTVELGKDRYPVNLEVIVNAAQKIVAAAANNAAGAHPANMRQQAQKPKTPPKRYNIWHLSEVWQTLQDSRNEIKRKQGNINLIRAGCGIFTMCAMPCISFFGAIGYALTGIGLLGNIYSFVGMKNVNKSEKLEQLNEEFQDRYICPNPDCGKFLGNLSYRLLNRQYSNCPYCKCEFYEEKI